MSEIFDSRMTEWREQIDAKLKELVGRTLYPNEFKSILEYALFPGGKRLRPVLFLAWHELFADIDEYALEYACGIEILHSYSLIHDDMPCMDNDDMRRGKPSVHVRYGEGAALLAGDALLDLAYRILYAPTARCEKTPLTMTYAPFGDNGLIHGQYLDLFGNINSLDDLLKVHALKTGALISFACTSGSTIGRCMLYNAENDLAYSTGGDCKPIITDRSDYSDGYAAAVDFGEAFGVAFQLYDDITEYIAGESISGTSVLNYIDLEQAKAMLNGKLNDAAKALKLVSVGDAAFLRELLDKFVIA